MKITDILQAYHKMPACDRLDLICRMLRHCIPYEMHFLGTILLDEARRHFRSYISKVETNANRVSYYSTLKDSGLTHEVCEKLCCALAVLRADNRPVAETIFNMLNDGHVMSHFKEASDLRVMQDFRLLYVMAVNHPALSFNQRQHLMYTYLQPMDSVFIEKCKYSFSGSFSNSMEKTLSAEVESGRYPPEGHFKEMSPDAYIVRCEVHSVYKRTTDKRYAYMIQVEWSDGISYTVRRTYGDFFSFQTKLLDLFPEEGGQKGKKHPRLIPYLPGKNYSKFLKNRDVAEKRLPELHRYSRELISLPDHVTRSPHVLEFFKPKTTDTKEDYPAFHKITTLYDLIESGKVRSRVFSDPPKGSPTNSPVPHHGSPIPNYGSPLQRAAHKAATTPNDPTPSSSSPRSSHTLPPVSSSTQQVTHEVTPIIPRRPTYPLSRQLQKSETSAFTPVGQTALSEDDITSTATLTASVISIPGSSNGLQTTPPLPSSDLSTTNSFSFSNSNPISEMTPSVVPAPSSSEMASEDGASSSIKRELQSRTSVPGQQSEREECRYAVGMSAPTAQQAMALWRQIQMSMASTSQALGVTHIGGGGGGVITPPLSSISPTQHLTSPTSALNSPLLATNFSPPMASPSPTHSGASTPRGGGMASYPQQILLPPYSPIYVISNSPLPSPLASPKTSNKWRGSYSSVNQGIVEYDTLFKWLKSLRLHKYHTKFENLTYEEMCQMSMEDFEGKGLTAGAAKKLYKKLEELKNYNFIGFRDMPFSGGMVRKLSTCSLPAALLMEQALTPSSSYDQFSPTGSTCSLDKYGHTSAGGISSVSEVHILASNYSKQHHSTQEVRTKSGLSETPPILSATLANGTACGSGGAAGGNASIVKMMLSPSQQGKLNTSSLSPDPSKFSDPTSTSGTNSSAKPSTGSTTLQGSPSSKTYRQSSSSSSQDSSGTRQSVDPGSPPLSNSSWADTREETGTISKPEWAQMPNSNGNPHPGAVLGGGGSSSSNNASPTGTRSPAVSIVRAHTGFESAGSHQSHSSSSSSSRVPVPTPHAPIHGCYTHHHQQQHYHHPNIITGKRNSHERAGGGAHDPITNTISTNSSEIVVPQPLHAMAGCNQVVVSGANSNSWNKSVRPLYSLPSTMAVVRGQGQQPHQHRLLHHGGHIHHNQNNSSANGLMRTPPISQNRALHGMHLYPTTHPGGVAVVAAAYLGSQASHGQHAPPPPIMCYNCGKRGHLGNTCPGITLDADNTTSFHKKLDRLVNGNI